MRGLKERTLMTQDNQVDAGWVCYCNMPLAYGSMIPSFRGGAQKVNQRTIYKSDPQAHKNLDRSSGKQTHDWQNRKGRIQTKSICVGPFVFPQFQACLLKMAFIQLVSIIPSAPLGDRSQVSDIIAHDFISIVAFPHQGHYKFPLLTAVTHNKTAT